MTLRTRLEQSSASPGVFILADNDESAAEAERRLVKEFKPLMGDPTSPRTGRHHE